MDANIINNIIQEQKTQTANRVFCIKCKVFVTREDRACMCDLECLTGRCGKKANQLVPSYRKCYTVYQYDREKYGRIYKRLQKVAIKLNDATIFYRVNPYKVLEHCYIRDEDGNPKNVWFEKHSHRRIALDKIEAEIAKQILLEYNNKPTEEDLRKLFIKTGIAVYIRQDYIQAEMWDFINSDVKEKLNVYFLLLRYLRCGCGVEDSVRYVNISLHKNREFKETNYSQYVDSILFLDKEEDEQGEPEKPKPHFTMNQLYGNMRLLDFFQAMTDKYTAFVKKDIKKEFCEEFGASENFFVSRFEDILEEVTEQASMLGMKLYCDRRLMYVAHEPYKKSFMDMFVKDKKEGLI